MYDRRTVLGLLGAGAVAGLAGCSGDDAAGGTDTPADTPTATRVAMTDELEFEPERVTVERGATVVWETTGSVAHSVTAYEAQLPAGATYFASGGFDTESAARSAYPDGAVGAGETYEHTFETAGEFPYFCYPHESGMVGTVVVEYSSD